MMTVQRAKKRKNGTGIDASVRFNRALHYVNSPAHAHALLVTLYGHLTPLVNDPNDDPLLYAYLIKDHISEMAGILIQVEKWMHAVIESTPDQVVHEGANSTC